MTVSFSRLAILLGAKLDKEADVNFGFDSREIHKGSTFKRFKDWLKRARNFRVPRTSRRRNRQPTAVDNFQPDGFEFNHEKT